MLVTHKTHFSIQEAGKACDLNPSVLRIWESRYGWPKPQRRDNGYRIYDYQQIEELKRIAELVRQGHTISSLIVDGNPVIPRQHALAESPYTRLDTLPLPVHREARVLHGELLNALKHQQHGAVRTLIERANWSLHPHQLHNACYLPVLVTLAETQRLPLGSPGNQAAARHLLQDAIAGRCQELLKRYANMPGNLAIVPLEEEDEALALAAALNLNLAGIGCTVYRDRSDVPKSLRVLTAGDRFSPLNDSQSLAHITALDTDRGISLSQCPQAVQDLLHRHGRGKAGVN